MTRDMRLIMQILEYTEEYAAGNPLEPPTIPGHSAATIDYHVGLCGQMGYLDIAVRAVADRWDGGGDCFNTIVNLAPYGHDLLSDWRDATDMA